MMFAVFLVSSLPTGAKEENMDNKQIVRAVYEDCINARNWERLSKLFSEDYPGPQGKKGPAAFADNVASLLRGFPDIRFSVEDVIAEGDRAVVRWTWSGTHTGDFRGFAPTGKSIHDTGTVIYLIADGKIIRSWLETDRLGVLQQLGVIPTDLRPAARR